MLDCPVLGVFIKYFKVVHVDIDQVGRQCAAVTNRGNLFLWDVSHTGGTMMVSFEWNTLANGQKSFSTAFFDLKNTLIGVEQKNHSNSSLKTELFYGGQKFWRQHIWLTKKSNKTHKSVWPIFVAIALNQLRKIMLLHENSAPENIFFVCFSAATAEYAIPSAPTATNDGGRRGQRKRSDRRWHWHWWRGGRRTAADAPVHGRKK